MEKIANKFWDLNLVDALAIFIKQKNVKFKKLKSMLNNHSKNMIS